MTDGGFESLVRRFERAWGLDGRPAIADYLGGLPPSAGPGRGFLLRRLIGAGRMGKVYEATRHGSGSSVAVKFLRKELLHHPGVVRRFIADFRGRDKDQPFRATRG